MTRRRIEYRVWGMGAKRLGLSDGYALADEWDDPMVAVVRSLARRTGLRCCAGPCSQGMALDHRGRIESSHYSLTLGRPLPRRIGGGYAPEGEVWVALPVVRKNKEV